MDKEEPSREWSQEQHGEIKNRVEEVLFEAAGIWIPVDVVFLLDPVLIYPELCFYGTHGLVRIVISSHIGLDLLLIDLADRNAIYIDSLSEVFGVDICWNLHMLHYLIIRVKLELLYTAWILSSAKKKSLPLLSKGSKGITKLGSKAFFC